MLTFYSTCIEETYIAQPYLYIIKTMQECKWVLSNNALGVFGGLDQQCLLMCEGHFFQWCARTSGEFGVSLVLINTPCISAVSFAISSMFLIRFSSFRTSSRLTDMTENLQWEETHCCHYICFMPFLTFQVTARQLQERRTFSDIQVFWYMILLYCRLYH